MEAAAPTIAVPRFGTPAYLRPSERQAAWLLGFAPILYLGLSGGGYDIVARSEVGVLVWWILLLGFLVGALPRTRLTRSASLGALLLAGFLVWTWIAVGWSQSAERSLAEAARVATYLGVFLLGLSVISRANARALLNGLAAAVAVVSALAVLSRLVPAWFPADTARNFYATSRLRYPFDYSDAVGEFAALGLPLLLYVATSARAIWARALAAAGLPVVVLCLAMTVSRGGVLASVVGLCFFFALVPDRLPRLATAFAGALGSAAVVWALIRRTGVRDEFLAPGPASQRHTMLAVVLIACIGVGLVQAGIALAARHGVRPRWLVVSRRTAAAIAAMVVTAVVAGCVAAVATGADHRVWTQFQQPSASASQNQYFRLFSVGGSHRYQYWQAAMHAFDAHPWKGIGPGTFEFYWSQHNSLSEFVRNAHSLYIESLAELGIVGLALIGGFVALVLAAGSARALRAPANTRLAIAACVAGFAAFAAGAAFDWTWQIGVIPFVGMLLAAGAVGGARSLERTSGRGTVVARLAAVAAAIAALWAIVVPLGATAALRRSQAAARTGDLRTAVRDASDAVRLEPSAATPRLQQALILEQLGDLSGALQAAQGAIDRENTNWRVWLVGSRLEAEANHPQIALADYRRARALNPTSPIFKR